MTTIKSTTKTTEEKEKSLIDILIEESTNKVIAIDSGKNNMKSIYNNTAFIYKNKIDAKHRDGLNNLTWNVLYKGLPYYVGDGASDSDLAEGKGSLEHKIQTLTTIANYLDPNEKNDNVVVIYGESLDFYFNEEHKQKLVDSLEGKHSITIYRDGNPVEYNFEIVKAHILPEGIGHIVNNIADCLKGRKFIVDFGGRTINFLTVINGAPVEDKNLSFSTEGGIYQLASKCYNKLKPYGVDSIESVETYIRYGCKNAEVQKIINETAIEHLIEFNNVLRKKGIDIKKVILNDDVIFVGGGTQAFEKQIIELYGNEITIPEKPILSNVTGFYLYGLQRFGKVDFK